VLSLQCHMPLNDRKAYALLAAYIDSIRSASEPPGLVRSGLTELQKNVQSLANNVCDEGGDGSLDTFLINAVERATEATRNIVGSDAVDAMSEMLAALRARAGRIKCSSCQSGVICCGDESRDSTIVAAEQGGECISEIKTAFRLALDISVSEYGNATLQKLGSPKAVLATSSLTNAPGMIPGLTLAANGATGFHDGPDGKISQIDIEVAPLKLDRITIVSLPYLLLHEVLCHAFQMARSVVPRPNKKDIVDPVAEGLMDRIAVELMEQRAVVAEQGVPFQSRLRSEADVAREIHLARASLDRSPPFPEAPAVALGVEVYQSIRALYAADGDIARADTDVRRLACDLNLHGWSYLARSNGLTVLRRQLRRPRNVKLIQLLDVYRKYYDPTDIIEHITKK
jgi:hypothetical protein